MVQYFLIVLVSAGNYEVIEGPMAYKVCEHRMLALTTRGDERNMACVPEGMVFKYTEPEEEHRS